MHPHPGSRLTFDKPGRGRVYSSILETIGNTPLVRIGRLAADAGCQAEVLAKLEFFNPVASVKDRIAVALLEALEADGSIGQGSVIVEPTSGNTGIGLAFACAAKGYRCILTMPESFSLERRKMMRLFGAELVLTPRDGGIHAAIEKAREIIAKTEGAIMPGQFVNPANPGIHRRTTAEEIWNDTNGVVDAVVMGVGTGGTLTGVADVLKTRNPEIRIIAVEPEDSPVLSGGTHAPHLIQGIGPGFIPDVLETGLIDEVMTVSNESAFQTARSLASTEGIPGGISSGAAMHCALEVARRGQMKGRTIVAILPSAAERYLSAGLLEDVSE
ncbi:cysteine synthase A [Roseibium sp.]|uniref:cysteine synthase A n=1 Tax=Roseibium sp. TaxID=1936156 RepID=UPI003BA8C812